MNAAIVMVSESSLGGNPDKIRKDITKKLQLHDKATPDRDQYLQHACELSVAAYFCRLQGANFTYEFPGRDKKNIDVSVVYNGIRFNLEVKCPNPKRIDEPLSKDSLIIVTDGRLGSIKQTKAYMYEPGRVLGNDNVVAVPNADHNVKEALIDSASKYKIPADESELNCVVLCGDNRYSLQHYWHCLYGIKGLFTNESFESTEKYSSVDAVILTNLRFRHDMTFARKTLSDAWKFELAFNLILENPRRVDRKSPPISLLSDLLPNYGRQLESFEVPGDLPLGLQNDIKIKAFIAQEMPKIDPGCFAVR